MNIRIYIYEFLAFPAHLWLWLAAKLVGYNFTCGPVDNEGDDNDLEEY